MQQRPRLDVAWHDSDYFIDKRCPVRKHDAVQSDHTGPDRERSSKPRAAKRHPGEHDGNERDGPAKRRTHWRATGLAPELIDAEKGAMQPAPEHEVPVRPMPQAAEQHHDHEVDVAA